MQSQASQLERLAEAYLYAVMPLTEYQRRRATVQQQVQSVERQLNQLQADTQKQRDLAGLAQSERRLSGDVSDYFTGALS